MIWYFPLFRTHYTILQKKGKLNHNIYIYVHVLIVYFWQVLKCSNVLYKSIQGWDQICSLGSRYQFIPTCLLTLEYKMYWYIWRQARSQQHQLHFVLQTVMWISYYVSMRRCTCRRQGQWLIITIQCDGILKLGQVYLPVATVHEHVF